MKRDDRAIDPLAFHLRRILKQECVMTNDNSLLAIGSLKTPDRLNDLLARLRAAGFSEATISVGAVDHEPGSDPADEPPRTGSEKVRDLSIGAASGGVLLGTLAGVASLAIPGLGVFLVAGPLAVALGDAIAGGAVGAVAGALIGMRIPDHQAKQYEEDLRGGAAIVSVHVHSEKEMTSAMQILADAGAEDLHMVHPDASASSRAPADGPVRFGTDNHQKAKPSKQRSQEPLPETIEEAEQDAADPTHEKEIPPK
jgi:hypothetical protein